MNARLNESFVTDAWRAFLVEQSFTHAITLTFRRRSSAEFIRQYTEHWLRRCNRAFFGRTWFRPGGSELRYAFVIETGDEGRLHAHVLLARPDRLLTKQERLWIALIWFNKHGFADVREIDCLEKAVRYLIKTIGDGGEIHLGYGNRTAR